MDTNMKVYSYRTTEDDFVYIRDGAVILITFVDDSEPAEHGMTAMGAEIVEVDEEGNDAREIERGVNISDMDDAASAELCANLLAYIAKHNL